MKTLQDELRAWERVYRGHGRAEEADLLERAAKLIDRGLKDSILAFHMLTFSMVAENKGEGHQYLARDLRAASEQLTPMMDGHND